MNLNGLAFDFLRPVSNVVLLPCRTNAAIKLLSQNSEVLRILIYTRLKINKK